MKISILILLVSCALIGGTARAQENGLELIDEFGRMNDEERLVRTENLVIRIRNNPDKIGLIQVTGGRSFSPSASYLFGALFRAQLLNFSKLDASRFAIQNCSVNDPELSVRFYLAARDAKRPDCDTGLPVVEKTALFGSADYTDDLPCCYVAGSNQEILAGHTAVLSAMLEKYPGAKVHMIGYSGTNDGEPDGWVGKTQLVTRKRRLWDNPSLILKHLKRAEALFKQNGIESSRLSKVTSGYRFWGGHVEFWFIPAGGEVPKPKPDYLVKKSLKRRR